MTKAEISRMDEWYLPIDDFATAAGTRSEGKCQTARIMVPHTNKNRQLTERFEY